MKVLAVIDVNLLASGAASQVGLPGRIVDLATDGTIEVAVSKHILTKLDEVLRRPYFWARVNARQRERFIEAYRDVARKKEPDPTVVGIADDEEDDLVLGTAVPAGADYLVTGDAGLLRIGAYRGVRIVTAREFLAIVDAG